MKIGLLALCLGLFGLFMLLHGLGAVDASWFRPNPKTPQWVFSVIGLVLMLSGILASAQVLPLPRWLFNGAGWSVIVLAMVMAHWLVVFAEGGRCSVAGAGFILWLSGAICYGVAGVVLALFDLIFALVITTAIWRKLKN
jgi:hypothetical protein